MPQSSLNLLKLSVFLSKYSLIVTSFPSISRVPKMLIQTVSESFFIDLFWRNRGLDIFIPPFSSLFKNFKDIWVPHFHQDKITGTRFTISPEITKPWEKHETTVSKTSDMNQWVKKIPDKIKTNEVNPFSAWANCLERVF